MIGRLTMENAHIEFTRDVESSETPGHASSANGLAAATTIIAFADMRTYTDRSWSQARKVRLVLVILSRRVVNQRCYHPVTTAIAFLTQWLRSIQPDNEAFPKWCPSP